MLKFIGKGSCFNINEINNSAYYKKDNYLLLIDCGESIFKEIVNLGILNNIEEIDILITHLHSDHVGSLPSLLLYLKHIKKLRPTIIYNEINKIKSFLNLSGISIKEIDLISPSEFKRFRIDSVKQVHSDCINAFGYLICIDNKVIYYSGDSKTIAPKVMDMFIKDKIDYFYQDVSKRNGSAHMFIEDLEKAIPIDKRNKVYCMHFDDIELRELLLKKSFNV